ncbi:hypothetical protein [Yinghuangia sp. YIM S10712]|uniref:hypothetical protein n=1 Tax=Yinghuangia sp. YIM S10712 TaxID=3436930 RepID=UPI003F531C69
MTEQFEGGPVMQAVWTVVWVDGDWRIELPTDGQPPSRAPTSLEGAFVPWDSASMRNITNESIGWAR